MKDLIIAIVMFFLPTDYDSHLNKSTAPITAWYDPSFLAGEIQKDRKNFHFRVLIDQNAFEIRITKKF